MLSNLKFTRSQSKILSLRLREPRRSLQIITGARQVGKTTLVTQVVSRSGLPHLFASADEPGLRHIHWMESQWEEAQAQNFRFLILLF